MASRQFSILDWSERCSDDSWATVLLLGCFLSDSAKLKISCCVRTQKLSRTGRLEMSWSVSVPSQQFSLQMTPSLYGKIRWLLSWWSWIWNVCSCARPMPAEIASCRLPISVGSREVDSVILWFKIAVRRTSMTLFWSERRRGHSMQHARKQKASVVKEMRALGSLSCYAWWQTLNLVQSGAPQPRGILYVKSASSKHHDIALHSLDWTQNYSRRKEVTWLYSHVLDGLGTRAISKARSLSLHLNPSETPPTPFHRMYGWWTAEVHYTASKLWKSLNTFRNFEVVWKIWCLGRSHRKTRKTSQDQWLDARRSYRVFWMLSCKERPASWPAWRCDPLERTEGWGAGSLGSCGLCPAVGVSWYLACYSILKCCVLCRAADWFWAKKFDLRSNYKL